MVSIAERGDLGQNHSHSGGNHYRREFYFYPSYTTTSAPSKQENKRSTPPANYLVERQSKNGDVGSGKEGKLYIDCVELNKLDYCLSQEEFWNMVHPTPVIMVTDLRYIADV